MSEEKDFLKLFFVNKEEELISKYKTSSILKSSKNKGDERELFLQGFLEDNLPAQLKIVKNVEIIDSKGNNSGEIDLAAIGIESPILTIGDRKIIPIEGVYAAFEIKSILTSQEFRKADQKLSMLKNMEWEIPGNSSAYGNVKIINRLSRLMPLKMIFAYENNFKSLENVILKEQDSLNFNLLSILNYGTYMEQSVGGFLVDNEKATRYIKVIGKGVSLAFLYLSLQFLITSFIFKPIILYKYYLPYSKWGT